jgi:hypothetical protein
MNSNSGNNEEQDDHLSAATSEDGAENRVEDDDDDDDVTMQDAAQLLLTSVLLRMFGNALTNEGGSAQGESASEHATFSAEHSERNESGNARQNTTRTLNTTFEIFGPFPDTIMEGNNGLPANIGELLLNAAQASSVVNANEENEDEDDDRDENSGVNYLRRTAATANNESAIANSATNNSNPFDRGNRGNLNHLFQTGRFNQVYATNVATGATGLSALRHQSGVARCNHSAHVYDRSLAVPLEVCAHCDSIVMPESQHSVIASALPLPHSMRRDDRWKQLLKLHSDQVRSLESIEQLRREQERSLLQLHEWRDSFSNNGGSAQSGASVNASSSSNSSGAAAGGTAIITDYAAHNNPIYIEMERSLKKLVNLTAGFQQTIATMLDEHRGRLVREIRRSVPQTQAQFISSTKRAIQRAKPNAMLYPTAGAICAVCQEKPVNVRLHQAVQRTERVADNSAAPPWSRGRRNNKRQKVQPCTCHTFSTCIDCLLTWYWEQTNGLQKSFSNCPTCRAEFVLEDIVPVFSASVDHSAVTTSPASNVSNNNNE